MAEQILIDADEAKKRLRAVRDWFCGYPGTEQDKLARSVAKMCIKELDKVKPADAVEVVRCKDCKHCNDVSAIPFIADSQKLVCMKGVNWRAVEPNHFCSYGERREGE